MKDYKSGLIMTLRYCKGGKAAEGFDARQECHALTSEFAKSENLPALRATIDMRHSFEEAGRSGFRAISHKWDETKYDEMFVYSSCGVLAAINVPGNGRGDTDDLTLIGVSYTESKRGVVAKDNKAAFLKTMDERRKIGKEHVWIGAEKK